MSVQNDRASIPESAAVNAVPTQDARHDWLRHWELWVALAVGACLRLWQPGADGFLGDQAGLMQLARLSIQHGAIPVTGIYSSISTLNPPLSVYVLLPFAWLSHDPLLAVISQECWNVAGVFFCYIFVLRTFGRRAAAISTALFATAGAAVDYSRLLWQQDYLPPFIALWALFTFAGATQGRPRWLLPATAFLTCAILLHPTAALLLPTLLLALLLCPLKPRRWEYVASGAVVALLLAPTLIWEVLSGWADIAPLQKSFFGGSKVLDPAVFYRMYQVLGGPVTPERGPRQVHGLSDLLALVIHTPTNTIFTPRSAYGALGALPLFVALAAIALYTVGWLVVTHRVFAPLRRVSSGSPANAPPARRLLVWLRAAWVAARADPQWRAALLLWVSVTLPPATMLDHSQNIYPHYLLSLFPLLFVVSGVGAVWLLDRAGRLVARLTARGAAPRWRRAPLIVTIGVLSILILAQTAESTLAVASFSSGAYDGSPVHGYGYTLQDLRVADARLGQVQQTQRARRIFIASVPRADLAMAYVLVGEHADRVSFDANCLILPASDESPALVAATSDDQPAQSLLATLPGVTQITAVALPGGAPLDVYRVSAPLASAPGDVAVTPATFTAGGGVTLRLNAAALTPTGGLRLRWSVLTSTPKGATAALVAPTATIQSATGAAKSPMNSSACGPQQWRAGESLYTWLDLPHYSSGDTVILGLRQYTQTFEQANVGFVPVLSARMPQSPLITAIIAPVAGAQSGSPGAVTSEGYVLPLLPLIH
ncbi:MAG TPA: glycosyltransferase family 39 protein [Ktedonobacterales bacterium]|nr:glycosyltransferase family 39 protein [Ktedonobacterales bacterium]